MFPMMFLKFPMCFPKVFPITPHFYPHVVCLTFSATYIGGPQREAPHLHIDRAYIFYFGGLSKVSAFFSFSLWFFFLL